MSRRLLQSSVSQGSVLGPLLWNVGFDWLLRGVLPDGVVVICYADDILVTARGSTFGEAATRASEGGTLIVGRIRQIGLEVALPKGETLYFHGPRRGAPPDADIMVGIERVGVPR